MSQRAIVVGASLAGLRAAEALRHRGHEGPLTIVGAEAHPPYDRPPLSKQLLAGKVEPADLRLSGVDELDAEWRLGVTATGLDLGRRVVELGPTESVPFDLLVIATGASPRTLPGFERGERVHYLRTVDDSLALRASLLEARDRSGRLAVVGAGFIGLEVAATATEMGIGVTVLEALNTPLERAIGPDMGLAIAGAHTRRGVDLRLGIEVLGLDDASVRLTGDQWVEAAVVLVGVGVSPNTGWLERSGLDLDNGVLCDEHLFAVSGGRPVPGVVAAGDVARWWHRGYARPVRVEHWTNAAEQAVAAAHALLEGDAATPYTPTPYVWSDQHGLKIQFVGDYLPGDEVQVIEGNPDEERFVAAYGRRGELVAALGVRRPARIMALQQMISKGIDYPPPADIFP